MCPSFELETLASAFSLTLSFFLSLPGLSLEQSWPQPVVVVVLAVVVVHVFGYHCRVTG